MVFSDFGHDYPFRRYSRSKSEVVENRPKFCMFLALHFFFGGSAPRIFGLNLSNPPVSDYVAKFHGDRSRDGGGKLAKEIKNITSKIEDLPLPPVLPNGRPNKLCLTSHNQWPTRRSGRATVSSINSDDVFIHSVCHARLQKSRRLRAQHQSLPRLLWLSGEAV